MRYRSKAVVTVLCIVAVCALPATATSNFRIGLISPPPSRHEVHDFTQLLEENLASISLSESMLDAYRSRLDMQANIEFLKKQHQLLAEQSKDTADIDRTNTEKDYIPDPELHLIADIGYPESLSEFINELDVQVLDYIARKNNLDVMLLVSSTPFDEFYRTRLFAYTTSTQTLSRLFDKISIPSAQNEFPYEMLLECAHHISDSSYGFLLFSTTVPGSSFFCSAHEHLWSKPAVLISAQEHEIHISAAGYEPVSHNVTIQKNEIRRVTLEQIRVATLPTLLYSTLGLSSFEILPSIDGQLPYIWQEPAYPFTISVEKFGFAPYSAQVHDASPVLQLEPVPLWLTQIQDLAIGAQQEAYASLGRSLLLIGAYVVAKTLPYAFGQASALSAWDPLSTAAGALAGCSLFDTTIKLFDYYRKTQYSSR